MIFQHSHLHRGAIESDALQQLARSFDYVSRLLERANRLPNEAVEELARVMIIQCANGERDSLRLIERSIALYDGARNELE